MAAKKSSSPKKRKKKKVKKASFFARCFKYLLVLALWMMIIGGSIIAWYAAELPEITANVDFERKRAITFVAADGSELLTHGELKGETVSVQALPNHLVQALMAIEDRRFYHHFGLDPQGIARAMLANIRAGEIVQGGSTLTQQLAKNLFLTQERTFKRKIQEALLALWLESQLTKDEILTAYFNRVYFGAGAYGIEAASQLYFNKSAQALSLSESALLVGLLKAPSRLSPLRNPQLAKERQSVVINAMKEAGYVHSNERLAAFELAPVHTQDQRQIRYFSDWLLDRVNARIGAVEKDLIVKTTLLPELQMIAEKTLLSTLISHGKEANMRQGAVLVVENNGALRAMIGGRDYAHSQFNRVTQAYRPPGSAFKPFVYLSALEQGWEFDDKIIDEPVTSGDYRPGNFADEYHGEVSLAHALIHSLNTATIRLASQVGIGYVIGTARKLGITSELDRNLSLALGSSGITLMEMVSAYLTFPNMGRKTDIFAITSIQDSEGNIYYEADLPSQTDQYRLFARQNIAQLNYVLEKVVEEGTGRAAQIPTSAAGKTGTSQNFRDAWFIGYTAKYTAGIWVGNDNNEPMNRVTGGSYPAQVWQQIMARSIQEGLIPSQSGLEYRASQEQNSFSDFISNILSGGTRHQTPDNPQPKYNQ